MKENLKQTKLLSPKLDVVFQVLFGEVGSEDITKSFLEAVIGEKITKVDLSKNTILRRLTPNDKMGILDVVVVINDKEYCNIEMQVVEDEAMLERVLFYWSNVYRKTIQKGEEYEALKRTISVIVTDFKIEKLKDKKYFTSWHIYDDEERNIILTDVLRIVIIELPKIYEKENEKNELLDWTYFLDKPDSEEVEEIMKENKGIREAKEKLEEVSRDEQMQRIAEWREDAIRLEAGRKKREERAIEEVKIAKEEAKIAKEEAKIAKEAGLQEGIKLGHKQGLQEEKEKVAKKMKEEGIDVEVIIKVTGLTKEQIESI